MIPSFKMQGASQAQKQDPNPCKTGGFGMYPPPHTLQKVVIWVPCSSAGAVTPGFRLLDSSLSVGRGVSPPPNPGVRHPPQPPPLHPTPPNPLLGRTTPPHPHPPNPPPPPPLPTRSWDSTKWSAPFQRHTSTGPRQGRLFFTRQGTASRKALLVTCTPRVCGRTFVG